MFQTSSILFSFIWFVKYWRNFLDLIRRDRLWVWKTKKKTCVVLTYSVTLVREIRKSHVAVAQRRLRNVQKEHDTSAKLFFFPFSLLSPSSFLNRPYCYNQEFGYHGNLTSHFSSLFWPSLTSRNICSKRAWGSLFTQLRHRLGMSKFAIPPRELILSWPPLMPNS